MPMTILQLTFNNQFVISVQRFFQKLQSLIVIRTTRKGPVKHFFPLSLQITKVSCQSPVSSVLAYQKYPTSDIKTKYKKNVFLGLFPFSRFPARTLIVNRLVMKKFPRNLSFVVDSKLQVPLVMYEINAHNISGVRNQTIILTEGL